MTQSVFRFFLTLAALACSVAFAADKPDWLPLTHELNLEAGKRVVYELQVRTANACREDTGSEEQRTLCRTKVAPKVRYRMWLPDSKKPEHANETQRWVRYWQDRGKGTFDPELVRATAEDQAKVRLGTLDDLLENTDDYRRGITLRYLHEKVGVGAIWMMPPFPNNGSEDIPYPYDNLGSPYAVTDYMHVSGMLSGACILQGKDEYSLEDGKGEPCWGNSELKRVVDAAHARGMKVMLDVAFNHFGRNYRYYDYVDFKPTRELIASKYDFQEPLGRPGARPGGLWDFGGAHTYDERLLYPQILDTGVALWSLASRDPSARAELRALQTRCRINRGARLNGDELVRGFNLWRNMLDWERDRFDCRNLNLDWAATGHYAGLLRDGRHQPARSYEDLFYKSDWADTRFLYHHMDADHVQEYVRNREYLFRVLNYWTSLGVDGYRLDHTIDQESGANAVSWNYIIEKVKFYASKRGQSAPLFLAEEFDHQADISWVVDAQIEGYVGDILGRGRIKDSLFVQSVLQSGRRFSPNPPKPFDRPMGSVYVMRGIATHDDPKPLEGTGLDPWTAAGLWGVGAASRAMAMILVGQELGEDLGLAFKQSSIIRSRFDGQNHDPLIEFYRKIAQGRQDPQNRALISEGFDYLEPYQNASHEQAANVLARIHHEHDGNVVFSFNNLWPKDVSLSYFIPSDAADRAMIRGDQSYKLVNVFDGTVYRLWHGAEQDRAYTECVSGDVLKMELNLTMPADQRLLWLRLEICEPQRSGA